MKLLFKMMMGWNVHSITIVKTILIKTQKYDE